MAKTMKAQAQEIERLRMELQRTSLRQKGDIPELTSDSLEEFVQEERVTQWMRLCVGALKEFRDKVGGPLQRPADLAGASDQGPPPRDHVLAYRIWEVLCKSHTAYMTRYTPRAGQEPILKHACHMGLWRKPGAPSAVTSIGRMCTSRK